MHREARVVLTILSVMWIFSTCKKEEVNPTISNHGKISSNLRAFLFETGSYWIYKDSITNSLDSTIVTSITKDKYVVLPSISGQGSPGDEEYYKINYLSFPTNSIYSEEIIGSIISQGHIHSGVTYIASKKGGETIYNAQIETVLDSFSVEGSQYHNVIKMRIQADNYISSNYNFYYVDSIGIIKKEKRIGETVSETWNLLRYNTTIKQY
jgi:hypothetical protein